MEKSDIDIRLEKDAEGNGEEGTADSGDRYDLISGFKEYVEKSCERLKDLYSRYPNYFKSGVLAIGLAGAIGVAYNINNNDVSAPQQPPSSVTIVEEGVQQPPRSITIVEEGVQQPPSSPVERRVVENTYRTPNVVDTPPQPPTYLEADEEQPNLGDSVENPIIAPLPQQSPLEVMCPAYNSSSEADRNNTLRCVNQGLLYLVNNGDCENREYFSNLIGLIDSLDEETKIMKKKALFGLNAQACGIPSDEIIELGLGELEQKLNTHYSPNSGN